MRPPSPAWSLDLGEADAPTNDNVAVLTLEVTDGVSGVGLLALTESDSCTEGPFLYANADEISVLLSGNDGQKQIYVCAQDLAGNVAGPVGSNTVQLDTVAPQNPSIAPRGRRLDYRCDGYH